MVFALNLGPAAAGLPANTTTWLPAYNLKLASLCIAAVLMGLVNSDTDIASMYRLYHHCDNYLMR